MVVNWSACSPSTPTIRIRIQLTPIVFLVKFVFEQNENKQKEAGVGPFLNNERPFPASPMITARPELIKMAFTKPLLIYFLFSYSFTTKWRAKLSHQTPMPGLELIACLSAVSSKYQQSSCPKKQNFVCTCLLNQKNCCKIFMQEYFIVFCLGETNKQLETNQQFLPVL